MTLQAVKQKNRCHIDPAAWQLGCRAGKDRKPDDPPPDCDLDSYLAGHVEGEAVRQAKSGQVQVQPAQ